MPSWKKVIVSGSDARIATLFTSGHLTASANISSSLTGSFGHLETQGNISSSGTSTGSFGTIQTSTDSTSSFGAIDADMYFGDGGGLSGVLHTSNASNQSVNGTKTFLSELQLNNGVHIENNKGVRFEGSSDDGFYTELLAENASTTRQINLPNQY